MTTLNAAVDKTAEKGPEKLAEKRRALGRGLESLLPGPRVVPTAPTLPASSQFPVPGARETDSSSAANPSSVANPGQPGVIAELHAAGRTPEGEPIVLLDLDQIGQNPHQTRQEFDTKALTDLAGSIQAQGVLQPIVVRPRPAGPTASENVTPANVTAEKKERFLLILGERRFRASKIAGKTTIPAIVQRVSEQQAAEMTLVENLQRQDLDCLEQATAFANLSTEFKMTQEDIGKRVGISREQVSNYLRLLKLPPEVQLALHRKELTYSHARLLLSLESDEQVLKVARVVIARKMSVALLQDLVMDVHTPKAFPTEPKEGGARWVDPNVKAAQRSLETVLGMRVRIRDRKGKGKITIEYGTLEDFDRVVTMLKGN
ncbi:MAG: ParB/RepB/Spo0J family partition protein [Terriglobales bacterium]|jgi:ParB family chromosome partitioning protein